MNKRKAFDTRLVDVDEQVAIVKECSVKCYSDYFECVSSANTNFLILSLHFLMNVLILRFKYI